VTSGTYWFGRGDTGDPVMGNRSLPYTASERNNEKDIPLIHRRDERKRGSKKGNENIIVDLVWQKA
jgi:hypothetical protein